MVIGVCHITLLIHSSSSLKDKRQALKSIIEKVKNRFNVSVAEVGAHDLLQRAEIGIGAVGNDAQFVNSVVDKVIFYVEELQMAEVVDHRIEIIHAA